jgi:hypothetical protein
MTPKEKAFELAHKFRLLEIRTSENSYMMISMADAKQCALIAVDEIIDSEPQYEWSNDYWKNPNDFWQEVKREIANL